MRRPAPVVLVISAAAIAVASVAGLTYYSAREFSGRAADTRASSEAMSFAQHSSRLATGDAFDGYIQILRYADDPILNAKSSTPNARAQAMQRLLYVNINKFTSLTLVDRSGLIFATTDSTIANVRSSTAFSESRANLAPANTDVILPEAGHHGYVEYSAPLRDPDGTVWGILLGRADPATLWKGTLAAAVDGSRNVIINNEGLFAAGVPDDLLRQPWHGRPLGNGGVRASIAGVDSICGLAPIGKDTQIDRGLNVASCLPVSLIQVEQQAAIGKQALITIAGAVLAIVLATVALKLFLRVDSPAAAMPMTAPAKEPADASALLSGFIAPPVRSASGADPQREQADVSMADSVLEADARSSEADMDLGDPAGWVEGAAQPALPPPPDIDALMLMEAYEQRNARLAERLRETVQARLLVAATEADEAFKLAESDPEAASSMHDHAMGEIEAVRVRELRTISQELFPGLTRLGLPGALRAMRKSFGADIDITLDLDTTTDSVGGGASRSSVAPALRLVMYRFALETIRGLASAGTRACTLSLRRVDARLILAIKCRDAVGDSELMDRDALAASRLAVEAYAGTLAITRGDGAVAAVLDVPAPEFEPGPDVELEAEELPDEEDLAQTTPSLGRIELGSADDGDDPDVDEALPPIPASGVTLEPRRGLAAAIEALQAEFFGSMIVALDIATDIETADGVVAAAPREIVENIVRDALRALRGAESRQCDLSVRRSGSQLMLTILSEVGDAEFEASHVSAWAPALEELGGYLAVGVQDGSVVVSAEIPYASVTDAEHVAAPSEELPVVDAHAA
jgi:hypothetical protein